MDFVPVSRKNTRPIAICRKEYLSPSLIATVSSILSNQNQDIPKMRAVQTAPLPTQNRFEALHHYSFKPTLSVTLPKEEYDPLRSLRRQVKQFEREISEMFDFDDSEEDIFYDCEESHVAFSPLVYHPQKIRLNERPQIYLPAVSENFRAPRIVGVRARNFALRNQGKAPLPSLSVRARKTLLIRPLNAIKFFPETVKTGSKNFWKRVKRMVKRNLPTEQIQQESVKSMLDVVANYLKDYLAELGVNLVSPFFVVPTITSFITLMTSLISCFRDKAYVTGGIGIAASLVSLAYSLGVMIYGPIEVAAKLMLVKTIMFDIAEKVLKAFGFNVPVSEPSEETENPLPIIPDTINFTHRRNYSRPNSTPSQPKTPVPEEEEELTDCEELFESSLLNDVDFEHPEVIEKITEESSQDYISLGLTATALIGSLCVATMGNPLLRVNFNSLTRAVQGGLVMSSAGVGIYSLISKCFIEDSSARSEQYANDIHALSEDLQQFLDYSPEALNSSEAKITWDALQVRQNYLTRAVSGENNRNLTEMMKQVNFYYFKAHESISSVLTSINANKPRQEPVFMTLYGPPGCGKTTFINRVLKPYFCKLFGTNPSTGCIELTGELKYFPPLFGKPICIIDEYNQENPSEEKVTMVTKMIGSNAFKADGAQANEKNQYFNAELVMTASNRGRYSMNGAVPEETEEAFWDRHNFFYIFREGQQVHSGRKITPGSKLRIFRSNGFRPVEPFIQDGIYTMPNVPVHFVEITQQQLLDWVLLELRSKHQDFIDTMKAQDDIGDTVLPEPSIITDRRPNPSVGITVPQNSVFNDVEKVTAVLDKIADRTEVLSTKILDPTVKRLNYAEAAKSALPIPAAPPALKLTPIDPYANMNHSQRRKAMRSNQQVTSTFYNVPPPPIPVNTTSTPNPPKVLTKEETIAIRHAEQLEFEAKARNDWGAIPKIREEIGTSPLVIGIFGDSHTGKSYTFERWARESAHLFNMTFVNTRGVVPAVAKSNTVYILDDVIPARSDEYCEFWEKCDGSNILFVTSNLPMPIRYKGFLYTRFGTKPSYLDFSAFSSEKLIRRLGYAGHVYYNNHQYYIPGDMHVYKMLGYNKCQDFASERIVDDFAISQELLDIFKKHLDMEPSINYELTDIPPPEADYDCILDIVPETMHTITETDFIVAATVGHNRKVSIRYPTVSQWKDPGVFIHADIVPHHMATPSELWERRQTFDGILKALLSQKRQFLLRINVGNVGSVYTTADSQTVFVQKPEALERSVEEVVVNGRTLIKFTRGEDEWLVEPISLAASYNFSPNHRDGTTNAQLKKMIVEFRPKIEKFKSVERVVRRAEFAKNYDAVKNAARGLLTSFIKNLKKNCAVVAIVGIFLGCVAFYGLTKLFTKPKNCTVSNCQETHYSQPDTYTYYHWYTDYIEQESLLEDQSPVVIDRVPHYETHAHDQSKLGKYVIHSHTCISCGSMFVHGHRIHTEAVSKRYGHYCSSCRVQVKVVREEGQMYQAQGRKQRKRRYTPEEYRRMLEERERERRARGVPSEEDYVRSYPQDNLVGRMQANSRETDAYIAANKGRLWADDFDFESETYIPIEPTEEEMVRAHEIGKPQCPSSTDAIMAKVHANTVTVRSIYGAVHGIMLYKNIGVTNAHLIKSADENLSVISDEFPQGVVAKIIKWVPKRDLLFFSIEAGRQFTDIRKYFIHSLDISSVNSVRVDFHRGPTIISQRGNAKFTPELIFEETVTKKIERRDTMFMVAFGQLRNVEHRPGDCGNAYISLDSTLIETPLIGIHSGTSNGGRTLFAVVSAEDIPDITAHSVVQESTSNIPVVAIQPELYQEGIFADLEIPVRLVSDEQTVNFITPVEFGGSMQTDVKTHDLGEPKKIIPIGYNPALRMPAGSVRSPFMKNEWSDEITFPDDSIPAHQFASALTPEVQATLNTDNMGNPSIVATRVSAANGHMGMQIPQEIRDLTTTELSEYYYDVVEENGGFRFYNTYEVLNGVSNQQDPLFGASRIDPDASAGIYYNKVFNVHSKGELLDTISVEGRNVYKFAETSAGNDLRSRYQAAVDCAKKGECFIDLSNVKLKAELRPKIKANAGKTRAFEAEGTISYMVMKKFLGPVAQSFIVGRDSVHHTGGTNPYVEWPKYQKRIGKFPYIGGQDHETFDKTVLESLLADACSIVAKMWYRAKQNGHFQDYSYDELNNIARAVIAYIAYSIEIIEGTVVITRGVVNSGILLTNWIDSVVIDLTQVYTSKFAAYAAIRKGIVSPSEFDLALGMPTLRDVHYHSDWISNGDDNLSGYDKLYATFMNFSNIKKVKFALFGMIVTPPSKELATYEFGTWEVESFCSRFTRGTYPYVTGALKKESIFRLFHWTKTTDIETYLTMLETGVLYEASLWQDEEFYNECLRNCKTITRSLGDGRTFKTYREQVQYQMNLLGLIDPLSGLDSVLNINNKNLDQNDQSITVTNDSTEKLEHQAEMEFICNFCTIKCKSEVALLKHKGSAHFKTMELAVVSCPWCHEEMGIRAFLAHDHQNFACTQKGCSARPRNLASADLHAACHQLRMHACYIQVQQEMDEDIKIKFSKVLQELLQVSRHHNDYALALEQAKWELEEDAEQLRLELFVKAIADSKLRLEAIQEQLTTCRDYMTVLSLMQERRYLETRIMYADYGIDYRRPKVTFSEDIEEIPEPECESDNESVSSCDSSQDNMQAFNSFFVHKLITGHASLALKLCQALKANVSVYRPDGLVHSVEEKTIDIDGRSIRYNVMSPSFGRPIFYLHSFTFAEVDWRNEILEAFLTVPKPAPRVDFRGGARYLYRDHVIEQITQEMSSNGSGFDLGNSSAPGSGTMSSSAGAANPGATEVVAMTTPADVPLGINSVMATQNLNSTKPPDHMLTYGGVTASLEETVMTQMFPYKTITLTTAMEASTLICQIGYGECSGYFKKYLDLHDRYAGDIDYYFSITGNAAFSGDIIVGWWFKANESDVPPTASDPQLYLVDWQVMSVGMQSTQGFRISDARQVGFYRRTLPQDETGKPVLLAYIRNKILNPVSETNGSVYLNIFHKPAPNFKFSYPKAIGSDNVSNASTAYNIYDAQSVLLTNIVGALTGSITIDAPNAGCLPGAISVFEDGSRFKRVLKGVPLEYLMDSEDPNFTSMPPSYTNIDKDIVLIRMGTSMNVDARTTDEPKSTGIVRIFDQQDVITADVNTASPHEQKYSSLRIAAYGTFPDLSETQSALMKALFGGGWINKQLPSQTSDGNAGRRFNVTETNAYWNNLMTYTMYSPNSELAYVRESVKITERTALYTSIRSGRKVTPEAALEVLSTPFEISNPNLIAFSNGPIRIVGGPNSVILNISQLAQPFVPGDYNSPNVATIPDDVSYRFLDYLRRRCNGAPIFFDLCEVGNNNVLAHCKYDPATGICTSSLQNNYIQEGNLYWYLKRENFNSIELKNFQYTTATSEPLPLYMNHWVTRKDVQYKMNRPKPVLRITQEMQRGNTWTAKDRLKFNRSEFGRASMRSGNPHRDYSYGLPGRVQKDYVVNATKHPFMERHGQGSVVEKSTPKLSSGGLAGSAGNFARGFGGAMAGGAISGAVGSIGGLIMQGKEQRDKRNMFDAQTKNDLQRQSNQHKQEANMSIMNNAMRHANTIGGMAGVNAKFRGRFGNNLGFQTGDYQSHTNVADV